ncbi:MAG: DNA pilot protein [Microvirus sp.]|nr:MAG: DNA pilot protein [Microvirus sp.]
MSDWFNALGNWVGQTADAAVGQAQVQAVKDTNAQNLQLMRESWAREDTAVQRRSRDLSAAGINPALAAGSAAQSGPPVRMENPGAANPVGAIGNFISGLSGVAKQVADTMQGIQSVQTSIAQQNLLKIQAEKTGSEKTGLDLANEHARKMNPELEARAVFEKTRADFESRDVGHSFFAKWEPTDVSDMVGRLAAYSVGSHYVDRSSPEYRRLMAEANKLVSDAASAGVAAKLAQQIVSMDLSSAAGWKVLLGMLREGAGIASDTAGAVAKGRTAFQGFLPY